MLRVVAVGQQARRDGPLVQLRNVGLGFGRFVDMLFDALDLRCQEGAAIERFDERIASFVLSCRREFERAWRVAMSEHVGLETRAGVGRRLLRRIGDHAVRGEHQAGNRCGVLQRQACDLRRVDDAHLQHVAV